MNASTETLARCQRNVCALYRRRVREACARGDLSSAKFWRRKAGEWAAKARNVAATAALGAVLTLHGCASVPAREQAVPDVVGPPVPEHVALEDPCGRICRFWKFTDEHPLMSDAALVLLVGGVIAALDRSGSGKCPDGLQLTTTTGPTLTYDANAGTYVDGPSTTQTECR